MILYACPTPRGYRLTEDGPRPRACRRLACGYCGPRFTLSTVKAIELAAPIGSAVVTLPRAKLPDGDRPRLREFARILGAVARDLRADGYVWEHVWIVEFIRVPHTEPSRPPEGIARHELAIQEGPRPGWRPRGSAEDSASENPESLHS